MVQETQGYAGRSQQGPRLPDRRDAAGADFERLLQGGTTVTPVQVPNTIAGWAIWAVIVAAIVAVVLVACQQFGVAIPGWIITLLWICVAAAIVVAVIRFLASLGGGV